MSQTTSSAASLRAGTVLLGRYRLLDVLGEGGMGTVWRALQVTLAREVALKVLAIPRAHAPRLRQEALALARLHHPNIVSVIDYGESEEGTPFLVMELVQGESLEQVLATRGALTEEEAIELCLPLLSALSYAHRHGIVHRDLKPSNVLLQSVEARRIPKLVDFGIALVHTTGPRLTGAHVLGTPSCMAPEQVRARDVDARADVWGAATLLYELVEGVPPFGDGEPVQVMQRILMEPPRPPQRMAPALADIVLRALDKDRERRTPSAAALADELRRHRQEREPLGRALTMGAGIPPTARSSGSPMQALSDTDDGTEDGGPRMDDLVRARLGGG